jgi:DNA-binding MarR family transcriptional regulator
MDILSHNTISLAQTRADTASRIDRAAAFILSSPGPTHIMSSQLAHETAQKLRLIIGAVRQHSRALEEACGIGSAQVWMLATIANAPDITVSQLSKALSVHVSTASNLLDKLARAGLVERLRGDADRRVVRLRLTDRGSDIVARAPQPLTGLVVDALEKMPEDSLARLDKELATLIQQMNLLDRNAADEPLSSLVP